MSRELPRFDQLMAQALPGLVSDLCTSEPDRLHRAVMDRVERPLLALALDLAGGSQLKAARLLGINRNTLRKRLRRLGLAPSRRRAAQLRSCPSAALALPGSCGPDS